MDLRDYGIDFDQGHRQKMEQTIGSGPEIEQTQADKFKTKDEDEWSMMVNVSDYSFKADFDQGNRQKMEQTIGSGPEIDQKQAEKSKKFHGTSLLNLTKF